MESEKCIYEFKKNLFIKTAFWVTANNYVNPHFHNCIEIGCCIGGEGEFVFSDKKYAVGQGDIFIVNQLEPHICYSTENNPATFIYLFFTPSLIEEFDPILLKPYIYKPEYFKNKISADSKTASEISTLIHNIHDELNKQDISYVSLVKSYMVQICVLIRRHYNNQSSNNIKSGDVLYNFEKIRQVTEYINNNLDKNITLNLISEIFYISESRLRHLFKEITGVGFKDYIINFRIENAKQLIAETNRPMNCVYETCGFQSISSFYRAFKNITGYSPAKYRKSKARMAEIF